MQWGLSVKMIGDDPLVFLAWAIPTSTAGNTPRYSLVFAQGVRFHRTRWPTRLGQGGQNTGRCGSTDPQYFLIIPTLLGDSRFLDMPVFCFCQANGNCFPYGKISAARPPEAYPGMSMRIAASLDLCILRWWVWFLGIYGISMMICWWLSICPVGNSLFWESFGTIFLCCWAILSKSQWLLQI